MRTLWSYPKVWNLGHPTVAELFDGPVVVQEKLDGSQFSFGFGDDRALRMRSKGSVVYDEAMGGVLGEGDGMFRPAVQHVLGVREWLVPGWVYRCEFLSRPKHNTLAYDRAPRNGLALFDIERREQEFATLTELVRSADELDVEAVLNLGDHITVRGLDELSPLLDTPSQLGGQKVEGVVIKNYARFGKDGKALMGKLVRESFREAHKGDWRTRNPGRGDVVEEITRKLRTPARWDKAKQHLRDAGQLEGSPRDIGPLMKEIQRDTLDEEREFIADALFRWAWPKISRGITAGFPERYKEELAASQPFGGRPELPA